MGGELENAAVGGTDKERVSTRVAIGLESDVELVHDVGKGEDIDKELVIKIDSEGFAKP